MIFDLMHLDGHSALDVPYSERRRLLEGLELAGPHWATPPSETGEGAAVCPRRPATPASRASSRSASTASTDPAGGTRAG